MTDFNLVGVIRRLLSSNLEEKQIFAALFNEIEKYHGRPVTSVSDLRTRDNKKLKGDLWEQFCHLYLSHLTLDDNTTRLYNTVWLWKDVPREFLQVIGLRSDTKVDNGIDIIAIRSTGEYEAVQCKYLGNPDKTVSWSTLSTFVGLCNLSGPWNRHIVMTTGKGVTRKVPRTTKDISWCRGTFKSIPRTMWMKMAGTYTEYTLSDRSNISASISNIATTLTTLTSSSSNSIAPNSNVSGTTGINNYCDNNQPTESNLIRLSDLDLSNLEAPLQSMTIQNKKPTTIEELRLRRLQFFSS